MNNSAPYIYDPKAQPYPQQNQPYPQQGQSQPNSYPNQSNYQQGQPYPQQGQAYPQQNQPQPTGQQYQQNYPQQSHYPQSQYNYPPQNQPYPPQNQAYPQQGQPNVQQYQPSPSQQPSYQQNQYPSQQNQAYPPQNQGYPQQYPQQGQPNTEQYQPDPSQQPSYQENQYPSQQNQPNMTQNEPIPQQDEVNIQQPQPNVSQEPNLYQNQPIENQVQAQPEENQVQSDENQIQAEAQVQDNDNQAEENQVQAEENHVQAEAQVEENHVQAEAQVQDNDNQADENQVQAQPEENQAQSDENQVQSDENQVQSEENHVQAEAQAQDNENQAEENQVQAQAEENQAQSDENQIQAEAQAQDNENQAEENQVQVQAEEAQVEENQIQVQVEEAQVEENQIQVQAEEAQPEIQAQAEEAQAEAQVQDNENQAQAQAQAEENQIKAEPNDNQAQAQAESDENQAEVQPNEHQAQAQSDESQAQNNNIQQSEYLSVPAESNTSQQLSPQQAHPILNYQPSNPHQSQSQPQNPEIQPNFQQNQPSPQESQPIVQQYQPIPQQGQQNIQQYQPNLPQQPNYQQNQPNYGQPQPNIQQSQPALQQIQPNIQQYQPPLQQSQPNIQQNQPIPSQQPSYQQNQPNYGQTQPIIQQNQPIIQQGQSPIHQGNPNMAMNNGLVPPQNTTFPPVQTGPKPNKFGIAIDIIGENTWEDDSIKFVLYNIQGFTPQGEFSTWKGYKEFKEAQMEMIKRFPGSSQYLVLPDEMLFLKPEVHTLQARKDGLATFLKMVACSTDFFYSAEFQKFLFSHTAPAKEQAGFIKQQNLLIMSRNPNFQQIQPNVQQYQPISQQGQPNVQQYQPILPQQPHSQQNQPNYGQIQPNIQQNQPSLQQTQPNIQQNQPIPSQNQLQNPQIQPNLQQGQPPIHQGNPNMAMNNSIPPQSPNTNFPPVQTGPQPNKFGIAIDIIEENTWEEDLIKFQLYNIKGSTPRLGEFSTWKGYKEFKEAQMEMIKKFPGSSQYLVLPDEMLFLKPEAHTLQARRDGLATFLKMVACSIDFFNSAEFQKLLFSYTAPANEQVGFIKQQNLALMSRNPNFQQYQPNFPQQNQPTYGQPQPIVQQNQPIVQQNQPIVQQNQPIVQQTQPNVQQYQPGQPQPNVQQNQPNYGQIQPNVQQNQPIVQQTQPNILQNQPGQPQPNVQQNQAALQQSQPNIQQNQPIPSQQPPVHQGNPNMAMSGLVPPQNPNFPPVQTGPQQNKFGIAIGIIGENTFEEDGVKFQLYNIQGFNPQLGEFSTWKGYMEFRDVQTALIGKYAGSSSYLALPDQSLFLKPEDHTLQARKDGLATFLKIIACSTDFFYSAEFQKFLLAETAPAKAQAEFFKFQKNVNKFGIAIDIIEETISEEDGMKFALYNIQGYTPKLGALSTTKGYKDFVDIRGTLLNKYPGAFEFLDLPDHTLFVGDLDDKNTQTRRDRLAKFLKMVACSTDLFYFADFQKFLFAGPATPKEQVDFLKQQQNDPASNISINIVREFEQSDFFLSVHKVYVVQGRDLQGEFTVNRRYSDFVLIREILVGRFPQVPFIHLPTLNSSGAGRMGGLVLFLQSIPKHPSVYESQEWQTFIKDPEAKIQEKLKSFKASKGILGVFDSLLKQNQSNTPQQSQPNVQPNLYQSQIQPNVQQTQPNIQQYGQTQPNVQQYQPGPSQQPSYQQNQPNNVQTQPNVQQNQSPVHQGNPNMAMNNSIPPQNPNTNFPPVQMGPQPNKFGIAIGLIGENTYEEDGVKFQLYNIQGASPQLGEFTTWKGYMEFRDVQTALINKFLGSSSYLVLPDEMLFLRPEEHTLQARREGLSTFLKTIACSTDFFNSAEFQNFLFANTAPAKAQVDFIKQQNDYQLHAANIYINVVKEFEQSDNFVSAHKVFVIQGRDWQGDFTVNRRYSDFVMIRGLLVAKFDKVPFISLPSENLHGPERLNGLVLFLQSIPKLPFVYQSEEWQIFIRYQQPNVQERLKSFKKNKDLLDVLF